MAKDLDIEITGDKKTVRNIITEQKGSEVNIALRENDFVIVTTGSMTEDTRYGDNVTAPLVDFTKENSGKSKAVSYTHLDVYKRQAFSIRQRPYESYRSTPKRN